jgi:hypothetical protein
MRWVEHREMRNEYNTFFRKPEGKVSPVRPRRRWEDNIRMDLREIKWKCVDRMHLPQDRDQFRAAVNTIINLWIP